MSATLRNRLHRAERRLAKLAGEVAVLSADRARQFWDTVPIDTRELVLEARNRFKAELVATGQNRVYGLSDLDLPPDIRAQLADAFANGHWRGSAA